jgi:uncharacterized membrane protein HdeD (DUF308 family)
MRQVVGEGCQDERLMLFILPLAVMLLSVTTNWMFAKGRLHEAYWWQILGSVACIALNVSVAYHHPMQAGVLFLIVPSVNAIVASIAGIRRIRRDEN